MIPDPRPPIPVSDAVRVAFAPEATYRELVEEDTRSVLEVVARAALANAVIVFMMPLMVTVCRTFVFVREVSAAAVPEAPRRGMTVAMDMHERLYGRPDLVQLLADRQPVARDDPHPSRRRLSVMATFAGLSGVLLFGRRRAPR